MTEKNKSETGKIQKFLRENNSDKVSEKKHNKEEIKDSKVRKDVKSTKELESKKDKK